jgi:hypothetical protein
MAELRGTLRDQNHHNLATGITGSLAWTSSIKEIVDSKYSAFDDLTTASPGGSLGLVGCSHKKSVTDLCCCSFEWTHGGGEERGAELGD